MLQNTCKSVRPTTPVPFTLFKHSLVLTDFVFVPFLPKSSIFSGHCQVTSHRVGKMIIMLHFVEHAIYQGDYFIASLLIKHMSYYIVVMTGKYAIGSSHAA